MGYKLKRIMIRPNGVEKQVRPSIPTQTYNISKQTSSSGTASWSEISIAKSGYKISKVVIETEGKSSGSGNRGNMNAVVTSSNWGSSGIKLYRYAIGYGANNYGRIEYNNGSSQTNARNLSGYSTTANNVCTYIMERTGGSATINGTTTTWTYTSAEQTVALAILDSATPYAFIGTTQGTNGPATITVTYEKA